MNFQSVKVLFETPYLYVNIFVVKWGFFSLYLVHVHFLEMKHVKFISDYRVNKTEI